MIYSRHSFRLFCKSYFVINLCCLTRIRVRFSTIIQLLLLVFLTVVAVFCWTKLQAIRSYISPYTSCSNNQLPHVRPVSQADSLEYDRGFRQHSFNVFLSDRLSPRRSVPDTRHSNCLNQRYYNDRNSISNLTTSVVIVFFNEARSVLRRTLTSIINRTPVKLLREIILINDESSNNMVSDDVTYISKKIVYRDAPHKLGLIKARNFGAKLVRGRVVVFLDSHVEVNVGWLEPLLDVIRRNPRAVALPMVDVIDDRTLAYCPTPLVVGGFNWKLEFTWDPLPVGIPLHLPFPSPVMSGGLLAILLNTFEDFGGYDNQMETWGGENLEMSFRMWMCYSVVFVHPCSRVGHIFRSRRPYGEFTGRSGFLFNSARTAKVWMDGFAEVFLYQNPTAAKINLGDLSDRISLRNNLKCRSFYWYLTHVANSNMLRSIPSNFRHLLLLPTVSTSTVS